MIIVVDKEQFIRINVFHNKKQIKIWQEHNKEIISNNKGK
jgi:hypothetical protein